MEIRKQKEMLEINTARQVENSFDGLICRLNPPEESESLQGTEICLIV